MADPNFKKISDMVALTTAAADDIIPIVDVSEPADADKNKKITAANLRKDIKTAEMLNAQVTSDKLANDSVIAGKIATGGVSASAQLAAQVVDTSALKDANVTAAKLATDAVETAKIKNAQVTASKLATDAVETAKIKNLNVTTDKLAAEAVTHPKIKGLGTPPADDDRIAFWDYSASSLGYLDLGTGLAISGTTLNAANIGTTDIADGAVTTAKIADNAVTSAKIASKTIVAGDIADNTITALQLAAGSVDSSEIANGSIDRVHLAADIIDGTKIADDAVNSEHIAAGAVDLEHMSANSIDSDQYVDGSIDQEHLSVGASKVTNRQGGSATNWSVGGNTNYALSSVRIQVGSFLIADDYPADYTVTYPVAFSQVPVLIISGAGSANQGISINTQTATGFRCSYTNPDIGIHEEVSVQWLAIGAA